MISVVIPHRSEKPNELKYTIESFTNAGANEIIAIEDKDGQGPAWGRNEGARRSSGDFIIWTDAHCKWERGDLRAFAGVANDSTIACAPCASMDNPDEWTAYGAELVEDAPDRPGYKLAPFMQPRDTAGALYGSVYAMTREAFERVGGWPRTRSWGYNEQALTLAIKAAGMRIAVPQDCRILHQFRKSFPYPVRGLDPVVNRMIVHKMFSTPEEWRDYWAPRFQVQKQAWRRFVKREGSEG